MREANKKRRLTTAIVLATFNGEKYIENLFKSLINQTYPANKIIIFDDASSDNTVNIIKEIIKEYNLKNVSLNINKSNMGSSQT